MTAEQYNGPFEDSDHEFKVSAAAQVVITLVKVQPRESTREREEGRN